MSISLTCPHCHADLAVHDRLAGKETRCPHCGGAIQVPLESEVPTQASAHLAKENAAEFVDVEEVEEVAIAEGDNSEDFVDVDEVVAVEEVEAVEEVLVAEVGNDASAVEVPGTRTSHANLVASVAVESTVRPRESQNTDDEEEEISFPTKELPKDDMDMTPMVDVTFLLLIFFMITASFSSEKAFDEPPPQSEAAPATPQEKNLDTVRVQIDEFNAYTVIFSGGDEREASSKQELLIALDEAKTEISTGKNDDELSLFIEAHTECIHSAVVAALDAARDKGFNKFQVQVVEEFQ